MPTQFKTEMQAQAAIYAYVRDGKADSGHISEYYNGGRRYFRAHVRKNGMGWCI